MSELNEVYLYFLITLVEKYIELILICRHILVCYSVLR